MTMFLLGFGIGGLLGLVFGQHPDQAKASMIALWGKIRSIFARKPKTPESGG
jgi:hypothetical protein